MNIESINTINESLEKYANKHVYIQGIYQFGFEENCLFHWPKKERSKADVYLSSIWLRPSIYFDFKEEMNNWNGKRVVVDGIILLPDSDVGGCGHMGMCPSEIQMHTIELYETWKKHNK